MARLATLRKGTQQWTFDPRDPATWVDAEVKDFMARQQEHLRPGLCSFGDWKCPREDVGWLCGSMPDKWSKNRFKRGAPFWIVYSLLSSPRPVIEVPDQQLSFLDPPKQVVWWMYRGEHPKRKRQWWVGAYFCKRGMQWGVSNEREIRAYDVRVEHVKRKAGCKFKVVSEEYTMCN